VSGPPTDKPVINITFDHALCPQHGESFQAKWPQGYALFIAEGFKRLGAAGGLAAAGTESEDVEVRNRAIEQHLDEKPICCRLGKVALLALYMWINRQHKQKLWPLARCGCCKKIARGGAYRSMRAPDDPEIVAHRHMCLHCVVNNVRRVDE